MTIKHGKQIDAPRRGRGGGRKLRPIRGALAMTLKACGDGRAFVLPAASAGEAALVRDAVVLPAKSLLDVCAHLMDRGALAQQPATAFASSHDDSYPDLSDVKGQPQAKRALEIAAAGQHSLLILCPFIPHAPTPLVRRLIAMTWSTGSRWPPSAGCGSVAAVAGND